MQKTTADPKKTDDPGEGATDLKNELPGPSGVVLQCGKAQYEAVSAFLRCIYKGGPFLLNYIGFIYHFILFFFFLLFCLPITNQSIDYTIHTEA